MDNNIQQTCCIIVNNDKDAANKIIGNIPRQKRIRILYKIIHLLQLNHAVIRCNITPLHI